MAASVLDVLRALPAKEWVTPSWVANRFGLTHYAGRQMLGLLHKRGFVDQGALDSEGRRQYRVNAQGRQVLQSPERVMNPERYWDRQQASDAHHYARRTVAGRTDPDEYARRRALYEMRKREGL